MSPNTNSVDRATTTTSAPHITRKATRSGIPNLRQYFAELWRYRAFAYYWAKADVKARNFETFLGRLWHYINPVLFGLIYFVFVGIISGGIAPNVISPSAEAELMFRTVGPYETVKGVIESCAGALVAIEDVLAMPPVKLRTVSGIDTAAFPFTTDIPLLDRWGTALLLGPGSIAIAHTEDEHIPIAELHRAADLYVHIARELLTT